MKRIILLEFKRTSDTSESYYLDMRKVAEKQHSTAHPEGPQRLRGRPGMGG
jgi:hypothetical protein